MRFIGLTAVCIMLCCPAHAALKVVTSLPSLAALVMEVGGEHVQVDALASASEDPHFVDPRPNLLLLLNRADLLVVNGIELEIGWLPSLQLAARNQRIQKGGPGYLEVASLIEPLEVPAGRVDRSMGDLHAGGNPHFLNDPTRVAQIVRGLGQRFSEIDAGHAAFYERSAKAYVEKLEAFARFQADRFAALTDSQRRVVAYHKSLAYLFHWLSLEEIATLEPRPGIPPDPGHVAGILQTIRSKKIHVIVQEEYYPTKNSKTLAQLAHAQLVIIHGGVRFKAGEGYLSYMQKIAEDLYTALNHAG